MMVHDDKLNNKIEEGAGKLKETTGGATGDESLRAEGEGQKDKAQLKDAVQDAAAKVKDI